MHTPIKSIYIVIKFLYFYRYKKVVTYISSCIPKDISFIKKYATIQQVHVLLVL